MRPRLILALGCLLAGLASVARAAPPVTVEIVEGVSDAAKWDLTAGKVTDRYAEPAFALVAIPQKHTPSGVLADRSAAFVLRASARVALPAGEHRLLLRTREAARLFVDDRLSVEVPFPKRGTDGHQPWHPIGPPLEAGLPPLRFGDVEKLAPVTLDGKPHEFRLEVYVGGKGYRPEAGEPVVAVAGKGETFRLLAGEPSVPFTAERWPAYLEQRLAWHREHNATRRRDAAAGEADYWTKRHDLARREWAEKSPDVPPSGKLPVGNAVDHFLNARLEKAGLQPPPPVDDWAFLRRVYLDTVGVPPTLDEIDAFRRDRSPDRRAKVIDRLLADSRWADHWVSYWQDVLAENPGLLKPTLNHTGPFRKYLHDALSDNLPFDRFVTHLVRLEGSAEYGGPAGFGIATENDVPMAAKATALARAFLGVDVQCARCHDAPSGKGGYRQQQLFSMAAMLDRKPLKVPATSTVRTAEGARKPAVRVSLKAGAAVAPEWGFLKVAPDEVPEGLLRNAEDSRERLAALITSPRNERFAEVIVNRLWARWLGWALVEPVDDWTDATPVEPQLLRYLAGELATHGYDVKHVARLILTSHAYQRSVVPEVDLKKHADMRLAGPARRRLSAEQLVDSLFATAGKDLGCEELTLDPASRQPLKQCRNLGVPRRAWELVALANERDRPALSMPVAQSLTDLMTAYGWRESRGASLTVREDAPTPLQPMTLANGLVGNRISRLSDDGALVALCLENRLLPELIDRLTQRILSRPATADERRMLAEELREGYSERRVEAPLTLRKLPPVTVTWANHLRPESTQAKVELEKIIRAGDPPTRRLRESWRLRMEDVIWALYNSPEFAFVP